MNKYNIKKLYLKNFKLVNEATINFDSDNIIVLDGPNGFGKTTIFDALELLLTGEVCRIKEDDGRRNYRDILFSKDGNENKEIILKVEFSNGENKVVIAKKFMPNIEEPISNRKPTNFTMFSTHILKEFGEKISEKNLGTQSDIERIFGITELKRLYKLYYYIQQEESTRYLRGSEKNRRDEISHLFNTQKEKDELKKVARLVKLLNKERKGISDQLKQLKVEYKNVEESKAVKLNAEYNKFFPDKTSVKWDRNELSIENEEEKKSYINELMGIKEFIECYEDFKKVKYNKGIEAILGKKQIIIDAIILGGFLNNYNKIEEEYFNQLKIDRLLKAIDQKEEIMLMTKEKLMEIEILIKDTLDIDKLLNKINTIRLMQEKNSGITNTLIDLNEIRNVLLDKFNKYKSVVDNHDSECPLCGIDWVKEEVLYEKIELKRLKYNEMYGENADQLEEGYKELLLFYKEEIIKKINNSDFHEVNKEFYEQLRKSYSNKEVVLKFVNWCESNQIPINNYYNHKLNYKLTDEDINIRVQETINLIGKLKKEINWELDKYDKYDFYNEIYKFMFNENDDLVKSISVNDIKMKIEYINEYYENVKYLVKTKIEKKVIKEELKLSCIEESLERANEIAKVYKDSIDQYEKKIINDIEILFYIYSGRILQYYQRGMGIFIQNSTGGLKFTSNIKTDHDAINYLSSGQLAALILSFTFTLNKIYGHNKLGVLLIDDPVQSMDDINMASLAELLRNELSGRQILISTHEDNVSRFLRYRFSKYGFQQQSINVKEKF
ncbi:AAA family ATPase [Lysinibacillus xylanilyticus]|uniref:AAA family ATPase n=1 Tax=Lysinibacillus xylanilyticus TaxID=582475 RepID=UPI003CFE1C6D